MLRTRALSAILLLIPVAVLLWLGGIPWLVAIVLVGVVGVNELFVSLRRSGQRPLVAVGMLSASSMPIAAYTDPTMALLAPLVTLTIMLSLVIVLVRRDVRHTLGDWAVSVAAALYVAMLLAHFVALRQRDFGLQWILLAFVCTWVCDSAAYLVGKAIGRRPFAPRISPHKTWEGTLGGVATAALAGLLAVPLVGLAIAASLVLGCAIAIIAVVGDLAESFLKRQLGIKDFSSLIPGHGGVLDRLDSLLFAVPFVYYVAVWLGRA